MAIIVLGGLVTTILFSLVGVPAMYLLFGAAAEPALDLGEEVSRKFIAEGRVIAEPKYEERHALG